MFRVMVNYTQKKFETNIEKILAGIDCKKIAIAVSGGADSISLLYMASDWAKRQGIELIVFSVDHNLRPEAKEEIKYVASVAESLSHECILLSWDGSRVKANLQESARIGRYDLMTEQAHKLGIAVMMTAHHADDRLETYLMRKERESGIFGLSESNSNFYNDIYIIRPVFNIHKTELIEYLETRNIKWFEDSSNHLGKYKRNAVRMSLADKDKTEIQMLLAEAQDASIKAKNLEPQLISAIAEYVQINNYGFAYIDAKKIANMHLNLLVPLLNYAITTISGKNTIPRYRNVEKLIDKLNSLEQFESSLHGCIIKSFGEYWLIFREYSDIERKPLALQGSVVWDNRFEVTYHSKIEHMVVGCMQPSDYAHLKENLNLDEIKKISHSYHMKILFTLPVIRVLEKVVAIPHISYYDDTEIMGLRIKTLFKPRFVSRFTHFF